MSCIILAMYATLKMQQSENVEGKHHDWSICQPTAATVIINCNYVMEMSNHFVIFHFLLCPDAWVPTSAGINCFWGNTTLMATLCRIKFYANTKIIYLLILFYSINLLFFFKIDFLQKQKFWEQGCFTSSSSGFVCQMLSHIRTERQTLLSEKVWRVGILNSLQQYYKFNILATINCVSIFIVLKGKI